MKTWNLFLSQSDDWFTYQFFNRQGWILSSLVQNNREQSFYWTKNHSRNDGFSFFFALFFCITFVSLFKRYVSDILIFVSLYHVCITLVSIKKRLQTLEGRAKTYFVSLYHLKMTFYRVCSLLCKTLIYQWCVWKEHAI